MWYQCTEMVLDGNTLVVHDGLHLTTSFGSFAGICERRKNEVANEVRE